MISLPELPYRPDALAPFISRETVEIHYGEHHKGYVDKTNAMIEGRELDAADIEDLMRAAKQRCPALFNNAAQAWNHGFYWRSMKPGGGGPPTRSSSNESHAPQPGQRPTQRGCWGPHALQMQIERAFGGYDKFAAAFSDAGNGQFGSGWVWLVLADDTLAIRTTANAETPLIDGEQPLLTMDVWEHAYYLDYQNRRADYVAAFLAHLVNWDFANENLSR